MKPTFPRRGHRVRRGVNCRRGTLFTMELLLIAPILLIAVLGLIELVLLWSAQHRIQMASAVACRIATLPARSPEELDREVRRVTAEVLRRPAFVASHRLRIAPGSFSGDPVRVEVILPMPAAAPDLLKPFGFGLSGRYLVGWSVMRKE